MAIVVPSRFSSLQIVEDDYIPPKPKEPKGKKNENIKNLKKTDEKKNKNGNRNKNNKSNIGVTQANIKKKGNSAVKAANIDQWEDAKSTTNEFIDKKFEEDLKTALQLSQLDCNKNNDDPKWRDDDSPKGNKEPFKIHNGKKQKKHKMILPDEDHLEITGFENIDIDRLTENDDTTFHGINKKLVEINGVNTKREQPSNEEIKGSQLKSALDDKEKEISTLKQEIVTLKDELIKVKSRNKKLCSIIGQGEMKEKAEVLVEVVKLREVQSELTNEVALLHAQLEQERSTKVDTKFKFKQTKTVRFDVSTEKKRTLSEKE